MEVVMDKCDRCIDEQIQKELPDYPGERPGKMPIRAAYWRNAPEVLCVVSGDIEYEAVCLNHLGLMQKENNNE